MRSRIVFVLSISTLLLAPFAGAFEVSWTDQYGETSYTIAGPDEVATGDSLWIVITAADPFYPNDWVASSWSIQEDGAEIDGSFMLSLSGGNWERSYGFVYGSAGEHTYTFAAQDLGHGNGAHGWEWFEISGTTTIGPPTPAQHTTWGAIKDLFRGR